MVADTPSGGLPPVTAAWLRFFPVYEHLLAGDATQALDVVERLADDISPRRGAMREASVRGAVEAYIALGTLEAAEDMARHLLGEPARHYVLSQIAWARGDLQGVKEHLEHGSWIRCLEGPLAGETRWSRDFLANPSSVRLSPLLKEPITQIVRGQVALADEDITTAIELLQNGLKSLSGSPAPYLVGSESLADAWEKHGDAEQAVRVLASASQMRDRVHFGGIRAKTAWFRIEAERANLLRELGRDDEAARIEADLLKLLAVADDDHQILRDLKEQQARRTGAD